MITVFNFCDFHEQAVLTGAVLPDGAAHRFVLQAFVQHSGRPEIRIDGDRVLIIWRNHPHALVYEAAAQAEAFGLYSVVCCADEEFGAVHVACADEDAVSVYKARGLR